MTTGPVSGGSHAFDLNIVRTLEHWPVANAVREFIANPLDEHEMTGTAAPEITKAVEEWRIRDYDVVTLDAVVSPAIDTEMTGTEAIFRGAADDEVEQAKSFFLRYSETRCWSRPSRAMCSGGVPARWRVAST